jgi:methylaspartate ammonia-lyase
MKIVKVTFVKGFSAFYFDDQAAVKAGAKQDGFIYEGKPFTGGFNSVRQAGECISVLLHLENGLIARGDCVAVQYSGASGRDPVFIGDTYISFLRNNIAQLLLGLCVDRFIPNSRYFDELVIDGNPMHTAIRYGISQALLDATALANVCLKAEVICSEYALPVIADKVKLFAQSGDDRYDSVDKMILKRVDALPHALINSLSKIGKDGEALLNYVDWLVKRIDLHKPDEHYQPDLHIDVYGMIGEIFSNEPQKISDYIARLQDTAGDYQLYIEGPIDAGNKAKQIEMLRTIKTSLASLGSRAKIVADEWCNTYQDVIDFVDADCCHMVQIKTPDLGAVHNTVEAVLYSRKHGIEAYQGGTCNETDISAQVCTHLALASRPDLMLVKPGMGFDEGMTIVGNEMARTIQVLKDKQPQLHTIYAVG